MCMHFILSGPHTSLRICNHIHYKKLHYDFPKMRGGGQRPFGFFPKIHPIWRRDPSLIITIIVVLTSCGGTSNETVLRSTFWYASIQGITKKIPGGYVYSYLSWTMYIWVEPKRGIEKWKKTWPRQPYNDCHIMTKWFSLFGFRMRRCTDDIILPESMPFLSGGWSPMSNSTFQMY